MRTSSIWADPATVPQRSTDVVTPTELIALADRRLGDMVRPSGLFCFEADQRDPSPGEALAGPPLHGQSVRYTTIVVLGALRQWSATGRSAVDVERHLSTVQRYRPALGIGDLGLLLWAESRFGSPDVDRTATVLDRRTADLTAFDAVSGMEVAWAVLGATSALIDGHRTQLSLDRAVAALERRFVADGPLLLHRAPGRSLGPAWRAWFPNFATEIYSLLALVALAKHRLGNDALDRARRLADALISLRLADGGWAWSYDARRGRIVEPYEVYSVHQDAMAPMALLPLAQLTGDDRYRRAAYEGLPWLTGLNPLGVALVDRTRGLVHRSIRRRRTSARAHQAINTTSSLLGSARRVDLGGFEVDRTCRPYHLGWILEAWSPVVGRPDGVVGERVGGAT